ncbi:MAG: transcriptional regulator [Candidatus Marinimicrobia bacterium]|nr:transcriptional regulator [Candidatus Neomarinimicrobiota bacterium]
MNTLTLKVPAILKTRLNSYASKKGISKSEIVRSALLEYLSKENEKHTSAFIDFAEDLAGKIDGPIDLSTNKKYFDGYGR